MIKLGGRPVLRREFYNW